MLSGCLSGGPPGLKACFEGCGGSGKLLYLSCTARGRGADTKGTPPAQGLVSEAAAQRLRDTTELDYMTHIVFRMYENKRCARHPALTQAAQAAYGRVGIQRARSRWHGCQWDCLGQRFLPQGCPAPAAPAGEPLQGSHRVRYPMQAQAPLVGLPCSGTANCPHRRLGNVTAVHGGLCTNGAPLPARSPGTPWTARSASGSRCCSAPARRTTPSRSSPSSRTTRCPSRHASRCTAVRGFPGPCVVRSRRNRCQGPAGFLIPGCLPWLPLRIAPTALVAPCTSWHNF